MNSKEGNNNTAKKGRKTKYTPKIVERICELVAKDTYSVPELCRAVGIDEATFYRWKNDKSEFCEALEKAEDKRLAFFATEAKRSLLKKIQGYTVQEKHIVTVGSGKFDVNGKEIPRIKEQKTVDKHFLPIVGGSILSHEHFQPDTAAIIFTLTNAEPERWRNRQNAEVTGKDGKDLIPPARTLTKEEAKELFKKLDSEC